MQVPTRRSERRPQAKPDPYLTASKLKEIKENLERLKSLSRPRAAEEVRRQALDGDFSENAGYQLAKGRLRGINRRIDELEKQVREAVVIEGGRRSGRVEIGSRVKLAMGGKEKTYTILGSAETDPERLIISHLSPLGAALLCRGVNEEISLILAKKEVKVKILEIT